MTTLLRDRASITAWVDRLARVGAPQVPLLRAAAAGEVDLLSLSDPTNPWPGGIARRLTRPVVALVGDDPVVGGLPLGPDAWLCTRRLALWRTGAVIHASGGKPEHYAAAVLLAKACGRLALIETGSERAEAWGERLACPGMVTLVPHAGVHPVAPGVVH